MFIKKRLFSTTKINKKANSNVYKNENKKKENFPSDFLVYFSVILEKAKGKPKHMRPAQGIPHSRNIAHFSRSTNRTTAQPTAE